MGIAMIGGGIRGAPGLMLMGMLAYPGSASAQVEPAPASAAAEENSGQDPTRPVTRLDLRLKSQANPGASESQFLTIRVDKPFELGAGWKLNTRVDVPIGRNDILEQGMPTGEHEAGVSDLLVQALVIAPSLGKTTFAFGSQFHVPIGDEGFSSGKWRAAPTVVVVYQLPEISRGTFVALLLRDDFSFAGDSSRPDTNVASLQPIFNWQLPDQWFVTFSPEAKFDTKDDWKLFLPFDVTVGKKLNARTVVSLQGDVALIDDFPQYDWQVEARLGFFF
jgi:hypothetical protein